MILTEILTIVVCILWAKAKKGWAWGLVPLIAGLLLKVMIDQITGDSFTGGYAYLLSTIALVIMLFMALKKKKE